MIEAHDRRRSVTAPTAKTRLNRNTLDQFQVDPHGDTRPP